MVKNSLNQFSLFKFIIVPNNYGLSNFGTVHTLFPKELQFKSLFGLVRLNVKGF